MTPEDHDKIRARQKSRAMVMGLLLGALVLLFYGITIAKMGGN
jgi:accessory gene regulator protein AgrB